MFTKNSVEMHENSDQISTPSPQDIAKRLAELNRWQEEQKKMLVERQNKQRQMLGIEQQNMYHMLGLLNGSGTKHTIMEENHNINKIGMKEPGSEFNKNFQIEHMDATSDIESHAFNTHRTSGYGSAENTNSQNINKPKRKFLKRGEGLKQRFKINPDEYRIDKLPRYKYANAHPHLRQPRRGKCVSLKPEANPSKIEKSKQMEQQIPQLDAQEKRFQQLLISSKNMCNSTPDLKSSIASSTNKSASPKVRFRESKELTIEYTTTSTNPSPLPTITWAKVLDTQQIKPIPVQHKPSPQSVISDDDNLSIFELLEQKAQNGSIDMNSSYMKAFLSQKHVNTDVDDDIIPVDEHLQHVRLKPALHDINDDEDVDDVERDIEELENVEADSTLSTPLQLGKAQVRVRFSDSLDTHEYTEDTVSESSTVAAEENSSIALFEQFKSALFTALNQKQKSQEAALQALPAPPSAPRSQKAIELSTELQENADLIKTRLTELENEIATFKANNAELIKMKQQHELEKAKTAQEYEEAMERLHDDKIQNEIYLHDERMKIESDKQKFEQQMKLQKSNMNTKEKREIAALKQEVETLQLQMKQKEQTHTAAQARLRAQIRTLEKDQKHFYDEIERLNKENKKLQQEAIKVSRENNTKMLQEINRNIAKLAPKMLTMAQTNDENGKHVKPFCATVTSNNVKTRASRQSCHTVNSTGRSRSKTKQPQVVSNESTSSEAEDLETTSVRRRSQASVKFVSPVDDIDNNYDDNDDDDFIQELQGANKKSKSKIEKRNSPVNDKENNSSNDQSFKREIINPDGSKDIWYPNGNLKKISSDGMNIRMLYFNKDIKETNIDEGTVKYYYAETNTWHTTYIDGLEILEFPNGQTEHRHKNGVVEVHFPNNSIKIVDPSDEHKAEEWRYGDGTNLIQLRNGDKILMLPNGQKEIHTKLNKRREYPDGTVKLVYPDGSQETRYSNGRVRLKDKDGKLIMDSESGNY